MSDFKDNNPSKFGEPGKFGELGEKDQQLLQSLIDGELSSAEAARLRGRIHAGERGLADAYSELSQVRDCVRDWSTNSHRKLIENGASVSLWERIAPEVEKICSERRSRPHVGSPSAILQGVRNWGVRNWIGQAGQSLGKASFGMPRLVFGSAAVCATALFGVLMLSNGTAKLGASKWENSLKRITTQSTRNQQRSVLRMPEATASLVRSQLTGMHLASNVGSPVRFPVGHPGSNDLVMGGLRSGGVDIDWIDSDKEVDILPVSDRNTPPVLWVAGR